MNEIYERIFENLKSRVADVNVACALAGIDDLTLGMKALNHLLGEGRVRVRYVEPERGVRLPLYGLSFDARTANLARQIALHVVD